MGQLTDGSDGSGVTKFDPSSATTTVLQPLYRKPELVSTSVKNWRILLEQSCTAHMPLLMATNTSAAIKYVSFLL